MASATNQQNAAYKQHRRVYLVTAPRTASNLFVKILNLPGQPNAEASAHFGGYFFMPVMRHRDTLESWHIPVADLPKEQLESIETQYQKDITNYREFLEQSEKNGKIAFVKEHAHLMVKPSILNDLVHELPLNTTPQPWPVNYDEKTDIHTKENPSVIPDNILKTFQPTFLIRHPALQIPSLYRAQADVRGDQGSQSRLAFGKAMFNIIVLRQLYDFYAKHFAEIDPTSPFPLLIDAADFITHPAAIMKHFCDLTGLDINACKFNWDVVSSQQLEKNGVGKTDQRFLSTIMASTGVITDKAVANVDVDVEAQKWKQEFGEETGSMIEKYVRDSMPDYQYLLTKRFVPNESEEAVAEGIKKTQAAEVKVAA